MFKFDTGWAKEIKTLGGNLFLINDTVKDYLLGREVKKNEILITNIHYDNLLGILMRHGSLVMLSQTEMVFNFRDKQLKEFTLYFPHIKKKIDYGESVEFSEKLSVFDYLKNADFTINAIAINSDNNVIDLFNGVSDLKNKKIAFVNKHLFNNNPLKIATAISLAAEYSFDIGEATFLSIKSNINRLYKCDKASLYQELTGWFDKGGDILVFYKLIKELKLFENLTFGEVTINSNIKGIITKVKSLPELFFVLLNGVVFDIPDVCYQLFRISEEEIMEIKKIIKK